MPMIRRSAVVRISILVSSILVGCTGREINRSELAGMYSVDQDSRTRLSEPFKTAAGRLLLRDDGTFEADRIPGELLYIQRPASDRLVTGTGQWTLDTRRDQTRVLLDFMRIRDGEGSRVPFRTEMFVVPRSESVALYYFHGDADEGNRIYFEQQQNQQR